MSVSIASAQTGWVGSFNPDALSLPGTSDKYRPAAWGLPSANSSRPSTARLRMLNISFPTASISVTPSSADARARSTRPRSVSIKAFIRPFHPALLGNRVCSPTS